MKVYVVSFRDDFCEVYSTKEKAVTACIKYFDMEKAKIVEFTDEPDGFSVLVRMNEYTKFETTVRYWIVIREVDNFDWED